VVGKAAVGAAGTRVVAIIVEDVLEVVGGGGVEAAAVVVVVVVGVNNHGQGSVGVESDP
jgi:hypothetical protein